MREESPGDAFLARWNVASVRGSSTDGEGAECGRVGSLLLHRSLERRDRRRVRGRRLRRERGENRRNEGQERDHSRF
jgi:hypothetical protein